MKKFILLSISLISLFVLSNKTYAYCDVNTFEQVLSQSLAGTYKGSLAEVYMNGSKDPVPNMSSDMQQNGDGTYTLIINPFKIGSMPGSISVQASGINVDVSGSFSQVCSKAVTLRVGRLPLSYDAFVHGTVIAGKLIYTVEVNAEYSGAPFTARVKFDGDK